MHNGFIINVVKRTQINSKLITDWKASFNWEIFGTHGYRWNN